MERSGKRYSGKPGGGAKRRRNAQRKKTTSCCGDVVFTEKNFVNIRAISWMEEFRNLGFRGIRGTEGLEVDFEVTRAHVETSPLWRLLNWGIEFFQQKKISCIFVWFRGISRTSASTSSATLV